MNLDPSSLFCQTANNKKANLQCARFSEDGSLEFKKGFVAVSV